MSETKYVYSFEEGNKDMKEILGGKGANLAEMTGLGIKVPPGFTITTEVCDYYYKNGKKLADEVNTQIAAKWKRRWARNWAMPPIRCWYPCVRAPLHPCRA